MNASISLIKCKEKFIINKVRKRQRMKIYAMWHMPHHPLSLDFFLFFENGSAAGAEGAHGSGGAVGTGMVKGKWECKLYVKAKLRKGSEGGNGRRSPYVAYMNKATRWWCSKDRRKRQEVIFIDNKQIKYY